MAISYKNFFDEMPKACGINDQYGKQYSDVFSQNLSRWIVKANKRVTASANASIEKKQEITDALIKQLAETVLLNPYNNSPFAKDGLYQPVLFRKLLFPAWLLQDIFELFKRLGHSSEIQDVKPHEFMIKMIAWAESLKENNVVNIERQIVLHRQELALNPELLLTINSSSKTPLILLKLLLYRNIINKTHEAMQANLLCKIYSKKQKEAAQMNQQLKAENESLKVQSDNSRSRYLQTLKCHYGDLAKKEEALLEDMKSQASGLDKQLLALEKRLREEEERNKAKEAELMAIRRTS